MTVMHRVSLKTSFDKSDDDSSSEQDYWSADEQSINQGAGQKLKSLKRFYLKLTS